MEVVTLPEADFEHMGFRFEAALPMSLFTLTLDLAKSGSFKEEPIEFFCAFIEPIQDLEVILYCFEALIDNHLRIDDVASVASYERVIEKMLGGSGTPLSDKIHEKKGRWHNEQGGWSDEEQAWRQNDQSGKELALALWEFSLISSRKCFNDFLQAFADGILSEEYSDSVHLFREVVTEMGEDRCRQLAQ